VRVKIELPRSTLEAAIDLIKTVAIEKHEKAALERRGLAAAVLRAAGDRAHALAEELHSAMIESRDE
jgi:hypothetical protein